MRWEYIPNFLTWGNGPCKLIIKSPTFEVKKNCSMYEIQAVFCFEYAVKNVFKWIKFRQYFASKML